MKRRSACTVLLAAGLALSATVAAPSAASLSPASADTSATSVTPQPAQRAAEPSTVQSLAQLCIDPRHEALVSNALRRGRTFTLAEARNWCTN